MSAKIAKIDGFGGLNFVRKAGGRDRRKGNPGAYLCCKVERNYDEIISEMLRQIDRHSEQLTRQSEKLEAQSARLEATVQKSDDFWREQRLINAKLFSQLDELEQRIKGHEAVTNQNLELILHTAGILDRIIKKNALQL